VGQGGEPVLLSSGKLVDATTSTGDGPPSNVVDGDPASSWNSGDFTPAALTIDLQA